MRCPYGHDHPEARLAIGEGRVAEEQMNLAADDLSIRLHWRPEELRRRRSVGRNDGDIGLRSLGY